MLKKIDWYIIKKYLSTFFFTMVLITMVAVVIDFSEKINKILDADVTFSEIMSEYYLNFIPWINGKIAPLFSLIAVIFFTSRLAKNSEIISVLSAGVSYWRLLVPYLLSGFFLASILWYGNHNVIPKSNRVKNEFESTHFKKSRNKTLGNDVHAFLSPNEKIYLRYYKKRDTTGQVFRWEQFKDGALKEMIKARKLEFLKEPNEWSLIDYERRKFNGLDESYVSHSGEQLDTIFDLTPGDFIRNTKEMETMTSKELKQFISREQERGLGSARAHRIELYRRTADPFTVIILTIIGVAVASRKIRGGLGFHLALGITLGAAYVVLAQFTVAFSSNLDLPPLLGTWIPNFIFSLIALGLIRFAQK